MGFDDWNSHLSLYQSLDRYTLQSPSELVRHKHQIKHIDNPIPVHVPLQAIRPKPLSDCLNRGFAIALAIRLLDLIEFDQSSSMQPASVA